MSTGPVRLIDVNEEEFVRGVHDHVFLAAVEDVEANLEDPPGRAPAPELVRLSAWYKSLSEADRANVLKVARMGADYAVFGLLVALDGGRRLASEELTLLSEGGHRLAPSDREELHGIFRSIADESSGR